MANMWKYITRNVRETFERRICSSLTDSSGQDKKSPCKLREKLLPTLHNFCDKRNVSDKYKSAVSDRKREERSHERTWNDDYIRHTWLGAVGWSTAIVLSWNLLQPLCRLQFTHTDDKERQCQLSRHASLSTRWGGAKGWNWKRLKDSNSQGKPTHWPFVCPRSKRSDQVDGVWDSGRHSYTGGFKTFNQPEDEWDSGHHSQEHEKHRILNTDTEPLRAHLDANYSGFWKLLKQTVWAQPMRIVPRAAKLEIDYVPAPEVAVNTQYGPPTAEQALDEAAANFIEAQNTVMGNIDNRVGVELMQQGKHHEAVTCFTKAIGFSNASAAYNLGVCYEMGLGTNQDFKKAAKYYQLASDKGHPTAMYNLGVFYVHGWGGLASDSNEAHKLFAKASLLGQTEAKKALDMVKEKNPSQVNLEKTENSFDLVQQALGLVQDLGLGFQGVSQSDCVNTPSDHKDISDMVQDSILKYTSMLQK